MNASVTKFFLGKTIKSTTSYLQKRLAELKLNYAVNIEQIDLLERNLNSIVDSKLRSRLEATSNFEILNSETITPNFLNLAKGSKAEATLADLRDDDGLEFASVDQMKQYVRNFYQNLYRKPACDSLINENCINSFLGDGILNSWLVQDSKIPAELATELELPISINELDLSASQGNRSASGMDGISNCFITKF
jgi:hypothetical protein